jgi:hypothetical protein
MCVEKMNGKSVMGQVLEAFIDPFGAKCKAIIEELTTERPKETKTKLIDVNKTTKAELDKPAESKSIPSSVTSHPPTYNSNSQSTGHSRSSHQSKQSEYVLF